MKLKIFLFMLIFIFSLISVSNQLVKRNLNDDNKRFLIIGFEYYLDRGADGITFNIYLIKYETEEIYSNIYFNISVTYEQTNKTENVKMKCNCNSGCEKQILPYKCEIKNGEDNRIKHVSLNDYSLFAENVSFYNNLTFNEDQIILSTLAKSKRKNIENETDPLIFRVFYLNYEPIIKKDEVELNGKILWDDDVEKYFYFNLSMPENVTCDYHYNYSGNNNDTIIFNPKKNINAHLNGMMAKKNFYINEYILIFANNSDDLILYSTVKSSSIDLYGFESYNKPENKSAENVAVFFGTSNILKKYLSFTAKVRYVSNSTLRFLEEKTTNVTANGTIIPDSTDIDNGVFKYKTVYKGTEDFDILEMDSWHDYKFSDDNISFTPAKANIVGEYINLTNKYELEKPVFMNFLYGNPTVDGNTFSFKFQLNSNNSNMNITNKQPIFLNYTSMETSQPDEIDSCTIENNSNIFTINCEPKKDIYTLLNSLIIKVPYNITTNRRLRFLQSSGNSTIRVPKTTTGDIQFDYNPEVNTFGRKSSKKKGLSGGAIAAIVLATIAAVVAVGVAMFFLNRGPINPIKTSTEMNLPNSTTNINN